MTPATWNGRPLSPAKWSRVTARRDALAYKVQCWHEAEGQTCGARLGVAVRQEGDVSTRETFYAGATGREPGPGEWVISSDRAGLAPIMAAGEIIGYRVMDAGTADVPSKRRRTLPDHVARGLNLTALPNGVRSVVPNVPTLPRMIVCPLNHPCWVEIPTTLRTLPAEPENC